ncbi:MAG: hypothetical protein J5746_04620 [Victivallales bacterium]|nr:hypothetical protein [Victivallales bacterium]
MSEADNKSKSFLQLIFDEIRKIFTGKASQVEKEEDIPTPPPQPAPKPAPVPQPVPQAEKPKETQEEQPAVASAEDRLNAMFSGKMQARDMRKKNAVRKGELLHKKQAELDAQEPLPEEDDDDFIGLPRPREGETFQLPPLSIFESVDEKHQANQEEIQQKREYIQDCLDSFLVDADVGDAIRGPRVTMYKVHVADGVMVSNVTKYEDEIRMRLSAETLRILAPVPGYDYIGVEVPNDVADTVRCGSILASSTWNNSRAALPLVMGRDIAGQDCIMDLAKAPHLLVAGTTGSGKSVCLNVFISSLVARFAPDELRLLLVDPKVVEMQMYGRLPHLLVPVINDVELVVLALRWLITEMERRYKILALAGNGIVNIVKYNSRTRPDEPIYDEFGDPIPEKLPYIVLIIDELADIMLTNRQDVENSLARLAQKSRAVGIHTIVATQRPGVDVITGNIKANFPTRIAFKTTSQIDSRTILDSKGAESLLGRGDMIFKSNDGMDQRRIQCAMVTDQEIEHLVDFWAEQAAAPANFEIIKASEPTEDVQVEEGDEGDDLMKRAITIIIEDKRPTVSYLQRRMGIGYNKAATLIETLEKYGIISPPDSQKRRQVLYSSVEEALSVIE